MSSQDQGSAKPVSWALPGIALGAFAFVGFGLIGVGITGDFVRGAYIGGGAAVLASAGVGVLFGVSDLRGRSD